MTALTLSSFDFDLVKLDFDQKLKLGVLACRDYQEVRWVRAH
jgi:hypothetical protein